MRLNELKPEQWTGTIVKYPSGIAKYRVMNLHDGKVRIISLGSVAVYHAKAAALEVVKHNVHTICKPKKTIQWIYKPELCMGILIDGTHKEIVRKESSDPESELFAFLIAFTYMTSGKSRTQTKKDIYHYPLLITRDKQEQQHLIIGIMLRRLLTRTDKELTKILEDIIHKSAPVNMETYPLKDLYSENKIPRRGISIQVTNKQTGEVTTFPNRVDASLFIGCSANYLNMAKFKHVTQNKNWSWKDLKKEN